MAFYPNRGQWVAIWAITVMALWMWIEGGPYQRRHMTGGRSPHRVVNFEKPIRLS